MKRILLAAGAAAMALGAPAMAKTKAERDAERAEAKELGSRYLRCDGQPNNMSDGESFARILGALTLLSIFAPQPEAPDPSKRLFAEKGVDACTQLIDGPEPEGNALRRIPLILARALHQIEAKNYPAAIDDVTKARGEADALGLVGNPYFDRSMGLSFGNIESEARLRMGEALAAQKASHARTEGMSYSFIPILTADSFSDHVREITPEAERIFDAQGRILPGSLNSFADRLEEAGRFAEAGVRREALIVTIDEYKAEEKSSLPYARAAISHALAGDWEQANARADFARSNLADRRTRGVPEEDGPRVVELLDLFEVLRLFNTGEVVQARRNFAARSQWLEPGLGAVMETNRRVREGAAPEELFGALSKTADELWNERREAALAVELQKDTDNDTLFGRIWPYARVDEFEGRSKDTWRVAKSRLMAKEPDEDSGLWRISATGSIQSAADSIILHAALQAKAQGKEGFTMTLVMPERNAYGYLFMSSWVRFANRNEADAARFMPADRVIEELSPLIPSPDELKQRKKLKKT